MAKPEGIFELPLHGLHVRVLNKEGGTKLTELSELDLARAILVDLMEQVLQSSKLRNHFQFHFFSPSTPPRWDGSPWPS